MIFSYILSFIQKKDETEERRVKKRGVSLRAMIDEQKPKSLLGM